MIFVYLLKFNLPRCDDPGNSNVARLSFWLIAWLLRWISTSASSRTFGCSRTFVGFILVHKTCEIWFTDKWSHGPILALMTYNSPPDIQPDPLLFHVPSWIKFLFEVDVLPSEVAIFKKKTGNLWDETLLPEFARIVPGWHVITSNLKKSGQYHAGLAESKWFFVTGAYLIILSVHIAGPYST